MVDLKNLLPVIRSEYNRLRIPTSSDRVYKDECIYSFDSPFSESGLFVNLVTFHGVGKDYLELDSGRTGSKLYLFQKWKQTLKYSQDSKDEFRKLAIGIEGGYMDVNKYDVLKENFLAVLYMGDWQFISLPNTQLPEFISNICQAIIDNDGMRSKLQVESWEASEERPISKYASSLIVENNGKKISNDPTTWRCEASGDTHNLWLNLSTGYIGGGRKNWDGSGGSGAALDHFLATGEIYPLCVKLGTITLHGADVWSYAKDEDCLITDPQLADHLAHWGIDIMKLEKTEKTLSEMEIEMNQTYKWTKILEAGQELVSVRGPGFVGLHNIGNSCYLNSVIQSVLAIPEVQQRYLYANEQVLSTAPQDVPNDFITQFSKVASALLTAKYVPPELPSTEEKDAHTILEKYVIAPRMFKHVVAKGHREFSSSRQQDASEFFQHLLQVIERAERTGLGRLGGGPGSKDTPSIFKFELEQRLQDEGTGQVKYNSSIQNVLELQIPLESAFYPDSDSDLDRLAQQESKKPRTSESKEGPPVPEVPFSACLESYFAPTQVVFRHPSNTSASSGCAIQSVLFKTFPRYLVIKLARYYVDANWTPKKVDATVKVPDTLDLRHLRGVGLKPGEVLIEDSAQGEGSSAVSDDVIPDETIVSQLMDMGFSENGCKRAAVATKNANAEVAMAWIFEHMEDPNFNDPLAPSAGSTGDPGVDADVVAALSASLGYSEKQVRKALVATGNDVERAADWLFSHTDDGVDYDEDTSSVAGPEKSQNENDDGEGIYNLFAVVSHMGRSAEHGHYVCHVRKDGDWILYNDEKVARTTAVPSQIGFLYFFRRLDGTGIL